MKKNSYFIYLLPILLITIFPIIDLYSINTFEVLFGSAIILAIPFVLISFLMLFICNLIFRDISKSTLFTILILLFFYYFHYALEAFNTFTQEKWGIIFFRLRYILLAFFIFFIFLFYKILKTKRISPIILNAITIIFGTLIIFSGMKIISLKYACFRKKNIYTKHFQKTSEKLIKPKSKNLPDIYFIVLDTYTSDDVLLEHYNYKNELTKKLESLGFHNCPKSYSNYSCTPPSLSATLNMDYHTPNTPFSKLIENNNITHFLECSGYSIVNIKSASALTRFISSKNTNKIISYVKSSWERFLAPFDFRYNFIKKKTFLFYLPYLTVVELNQYRKVILNQIKQLKLSVNMKNPKFIFCHILCPHPPFVFNENGDLPTQFFEWSDNNDKYLNQVKFINKKIYNAIEHILENSNPKPIIILQGDHGTGVIKNVVFVGGKTNINPFPIYFINHAFSILNAWYIPNKKSLKPPSSPVNNFRFIFDNYFDTKLGLLPDRSFMHRRNETELTFINVDNLLREPQKSQFTNIDFSA